jgi:hypothetical protein
MCAENLILRSKLIGNAAKRFMGGHGTSCPDIFHRSIELSHTFGDVVSLNFSGSSASLSWILSQRSSNFAASRKNIFGMPLPLNSVPRFSRYRVQ